MKDLHDMLKKNTERVLAFINELFEEEEEDGAFFDFPDLLTLHNLICSISALKPIAWDLLAFLNLMNEILGFLSVIGEHIRFN